MRSSYMVYFSIFECRCPCATSKNALASIHLAHSNYSTVSTLSHAEAPLMKAGVVSTKHLARDAYQADNVILLREQNVAPVQVRVAVSITEKLFPKENNGRCLFL